MMKNAAQHAAWQWITWAVFIILLLGTVYFHEPWFDEIQAWLIAKQASLKDILWLLPHYEGHPPFFHLVLRLPASLGISGLASLHIIGALCSIATAYLIIFKSPFPRFVRICLPFSYFLFYQYGVVVRPYTLMTLLMCLLAVCFPQRNKRPALFVALLAALCMCHLFGIAIAGGITAAWLWEIKDGRSWKTYLNGLLHDKRFYWMLGLLVLAVGLLWQIHPYANTFAVSPTFSHGNLLSQLFYLLIILPAETVLSNIYQVRLPLSALSFAGHELLCGALVGILVWITIFRCLTKKGITYLLLPYLFTVVPMSYYMSRHHQGIILLIILFAVWICWQNESIRLSIFEKTICILALLCSASWTVLNCYFEFKYPIFTGKQVIAFLNEHQLINKRIFAPWFYLRPEEVANLPKFTKLDREDTNFSAMAAELSFYTGRNIFANVNGGNSFTYVTHIHPTPFENQANLAAWRAGGLPDVFIGELELDHVFKQNDIRSNYAIVSQVEYYDLWKFNKPQHKLLPIYARKDLLEKHHLTPETELSFFHRQWDLKILGNMIE